MSKYTNVTIRQLLESDARARSALRVLRLAPTDPQAWRKALRAARSAGQYIEIEYTSHLRWTHTIVGSDDIDLYTTSPLAIPLQTLERAKFHRMELVDSSTQESLDESDAKLSGLLRKLKTNMGDAETARKLFREAERSDKIMVLYVGPTPIRHRIEYWHTDGSIRSAAQFGSVGMSVRLNRYNHSSWGDLIDRMGDNKIVVDVV